MLAVGGKAVSVRGHHRGIGDDHLDTGFGLTDGDVFPVFVSREVREREPVRHLHSVLVLRGNGFASQEGEHYRNGRSGGGRGQNATRFENGDMIILLDWCELR